jgi:thiamine transporter ThiT
MGVFGKMARKEKGVLPLVLGCISVCTLRFVFHLCSGAIFFMEGAVWVDFPAWAVSNAFIYSFIYQCVYIPADCLVNVLALVALAKTGALDTLISLMKKKTKN